jgi:predicted aspartyl protease
MGLTHVTLTVRRHKGSEPGVEQEFVVDSGAGLTVVPGDLLRRLGVEPDDEQSFTLANGEHITRKTGDAYFEYGDRRGYSKVIFGEEGDSAVLGTLTLEMFRLVLDPFRRELKPLPTLYL